VQYELSLAKRGRASRAALLDTAADEKPAEKGRPEEAEA
jgi:hypothetical protein